MTASVLCLVDLDQRLLIPLAAEGDRGGVRLWVPLMDGAERLGVLGAIVERDAEEARSSCRRWPAWPPVWWCRRAPTGTTWSWPAGSGTWTWPPSCVGPTFRR